MRVRAERWAPWVGMLLSLASLALSLSLVLRFSWKASLMLSDAIAKAERAVQGADNARMRWEIDTRNVLRDLAVAEARIEQLEEEMRDARRSADPDPAASAPQQ